LSQPLSRSPDSQPFGAGLKKKADLETTTDVSLDKENASAAKPWKQPKEAARALETTVQPTVFKSDSKGAMLVYSPGKNHTHARCDANDTTTLLGQLLTVPLALKSPGPVKQTEPAPEPPRPRNGVVLQYSPGNGQHKPTALFCMPLCAAATPKFASQSWRIAFCHFF
jgi:hypothetical protein